MLLVGGRWNVARKPHQLRKNNLRLQEYYLHQPVQGNLPALWVWEMKENRCWCRSKVGSRLERLIVSHVECNPLSKLPAFVSAIRCKVILILSGEVTDRKPLTCWLFLPMGVLGTPTCVYCKVVCKRWLSSLGVTSDTFLFSRNC